MRSATTPPAAHLRLLVAGSSISSLGSGVASLAFSYISYKISGSLAIAVVVLALQSLPSAFLIKPAAHLASRYDLRLVVAGAEAAKCVIYVAVGVLVLMGYLSLGLLMVTALVSGSVSALNYPAWNKLLVRVAPQGQLDRLDASLSSWGAVAGILGVLIGGQMLDGLGAASLFFVNAISYLFPLLAVLRQPAMPPEPLPPGTKPESFASDARLLFTVATLRRVVILAILLELVAWPILKLLPRVAEDVDPTSQTFSLLLGAFYLGNSGVSIFLARGKKHYGYQAIMLASLVVLAIALVAMWMSGLLPGGVGHVIVLMLIIAPIGLALSLVVTVISASIQLGAPDSKEIRVFAVYSAAVTLVAPIGGLAITGLVGVLDIWVVVAVEAIGVLALVAYVGWSSLGKDLRTFAEKDRDGLMLRRHSRHPVVNSLERGVAHRSEAALRDLDHRAPEAPEGPGSIERPTGA
ncbi:MAG: MFS transporter [Candidatus Nanopelagicales bacterium]|jgi:MFS family permease|nr:MFS transporter [Candidatus Nanopelagicales bacterium]MDP4715132.1 MFS transporter [Candidatus Nanopelagicales bacterium]MDP4975388.1 MFS transporter [Candidatus Nanopelagicales bacterium]MDP5094333.1 MFS transporter [Candidatus Nanopelagicales bacterium]